MRTQSILDKDVQQAGRDVRQFADGIQSEGEQAATSLRQHLTPLIASAKDKVARLGGEVRYQAGQAAAATDKVVHDNPWKFIGAAAAAGLVVGLLANRRRH